MGYNDDKTVNVFQANEAKLAFEHAQRMTQPVSPDPAFTGAPVMLVPKDWKAEPVPGWELRIPDRIRATVHLADHDSFCRYVQDFKTPKTQIFAAIDNEKGCFTAVFDYHDRPYVTAESAAQGTAGNCNHRAIFAPRHSENWKRWSAINKKAMTQNEFALFLEDNTPDVMNPLGADLLTIINEFEVEGAINFQRVQRLANGTVSFHFSNDQKAKAGQLSVPEMFNLQLPIFDGEPVFFLGARLRYRLSAGGELKIWFELVNPHLVIRESLQQLLTRIATGTGITPLLGALQ